MDKSEEISRKMSGSTDVAITTMADSQTDTVRGNILALLELKKPRSLEEKNHTPLCVNILPRFTSILIFQLFRF